MKLLQLKYFQAACRHKSITKAAESLHVSQPSISAAIKDIENEFGITLFNRQYHGFTLTKEGVELLKQTDNLLAHSDKVVEIMQDLGNHRNLIHLGIPPMIGSLLLPKIYLEFARKHSNTNLKIYEAGRQDLLYQLETNNLDIIFLPHTTSFDSQYKWIEICQIETVLCVPITHHLAGRSSIKISELEHEPLVMFKDSFYQNEIITRFFAECNISPNIILNSSQLSTIISLIQNHTASGFLFRIVAENYPELVSISLDPPLQIQVSLVWKKGEYMFRDVNYFIQYIKKMKF